MKIKKINRFSSPAKKFRGFSRNLEGFWKQIHEWQPGQKSLRARKSLRKLKKSPGNSRNCAGSPDPGRAAAKSQGHLRSVEKSEF